MKKHKSSKAMLRKARRNYRAMQSKTAHLVQLSWQSPLAKPTIAIHEAREAHSAPAIFIYKSEFDYLSRCILDYLSEETGGQLYGFYTEKGEFVIVYAIGPGPQANHQITFFNQDKEYLLKVNHVMLKHGLQKIGEWHSHHQLGLNRPSGHDVNSVVSVMRKYQINSHLLCIGNIDHKGRSTENAFTFSKDNDYCTQHAAWKVIDMDSPFRPLIEMQLAAQRKKLLGNKIDVRFDNSVVAMIAQKAYSLEYGARPVNRAIKENIIDALCMALLRQEVSKTVPIEVTANGDQIVIKN